jgi:hypothetical protein
MSPSIDGEYPYEGLHMRIKHENKPKKRTGRGNRKDVSYFLFCIIRIKR